MQAMKRWMFLAPMLSAAQVFAAPATEVAWTPETLAFVKRGNALRGEKAAEACAGCHGPKGASEVPDFPSLGGQLANYLFRQLKDYKNGQRSDPVMGGIAATLDDQTMADLAAYYASLPAPGPAIESSADENVARLVAVGDSKRLIPGCRVCHGGQGQGEPMDNPALAGQQAGYLEKTLLDYKQGIRHNDVYSRMRFIARQLTFDEIAQLAEYYGGRSR